MTKLTSRLKITALLGLTALGFAAAQGSSPIKVTSSLQKVSTVTENGKSVVKLSDSNGKGVVPGEILQFTYKYQNISSTTIKGNRLDTAVSAATAFQSQRCDAAGTTALFTTDKQSLNKDGQVSNVGTMKFAAAPLKKTVTVKENGVDVKKEVTVDPSEYTAVRWNLPDIKAGQTFTCTMRVKVK